MLSDREATGVSLLRDDAHRGSGALAASFDWRRYVDTRILEITCGEAPFIVSRYDAATGKLIPVKERIGLLDRKLRAVNENAADEEEWMKWAVRAYESVYGYEYQGDSLAIARANLLITFAENLEARWGRKATTHELTAIANRIVWNFWQMDGLMGMVSVWKTIEIQHLPGFDPPKPPEQMEFFPEPKEEKKGTPLRQEKACIIFDWRARRPVTYNEIGRAASTMPPVGSRVPRDRKSTSTKGTKTMKFDYAIGNPPYQEETGGTCTSDKPIYHLFMDEAYKVADKVELITPARFLFNAGATPKAWNKQMLEDSHLKVLEHVQKSDQVFANTDIKGGVAVTYRDSAKEFGAIETFTSYSELNSILKKVEETSSGYLSDIISNRGLYRFSEKAYKEQAEELKKTSDPRISTDAFKEMGKLFTEEKLDNGGTYFRILGNLKGKRVYRWFRLDYLVPIENLKKYKVILPKANGSGAIGEVLSTPMIGAPMLGFTETYISIGSYARKDEAEACLKYVKTKFARTMLGVLKITQDNTRPVWRKVPLQDFTSTSDINWSGTVEEIDKQLYKKYKLTKAEIKFIETHVKAME
jgi:type II restriction enzyme